MNRLKGIPYGISDFNRLRNDNFYFVDKTIFPLPVPVALGKACS